MLMNVGRTPHAVISSAQINLVAMNVLANLDTDSMLITARVKVILDMKERFGGYLGDFEGSLLSFSLF